MNNRATERRKARRKWKLRIAATEKSADLRCAACNDYAPPMPIASRYSETQLLEQTWRCTRCGNQWTTSAKGPP
jgi:Pyruvate/2-oxoacid:ferredoxin oxidoreductase delta subunit